VTAGCHGVSTHLRASGSRLFRFWSKIFGECCGFPFPLCRKKGKAAYKRFSSQPSNVGKLEKLNWGRGAACPTHIAKPDPPWYNNRTIFS